MKTYSSVLPYCRAQTSSSPSVTVSIPYFSRYLRIRIRILKLTKRRCKLYIAMIGLCTNPTYQRFPEEGGKTIHNDTMSVLSVLNIPWPQSKSNIDDDSTQQCNSSICVYFCSVHKNPKSNINFWLGISYGDVHICLPVHTACEVVIFVTPRIKPRILQSVGNQVCVISQLNP